MCIVSNITGYGQTFPDDWWDYQKWREYKRLLDQAQKWDEIASQPDCVDPEKKIWIEKIDKLIELLEKEKNNDANK